MNGGESSASWLALLDETQPVPSLSLLTEPEIDELLEKIGG